MYLLRDKMQSCRSHGEVVCDELWQRGHLYKMERTGLTTLSLDGKRQWKCINGEGRKSEINKWNEWKKGKCDGALPSSRCWHRCECVLVVRQKQQLQPHIWLSFPSGPSTKNRISWYLSRLPQSRSSTALYWLLISLDVLSHHITQQQNRQ